MADTTLDTLVQKRQQTQERMRELGIPMWITWVEDNGAENSKVPIIGAPPGAANRAYVLTPDKAVSFCFHTEAGKQEEYGFELVRTDRDVLTPLVTGLQDYFDMSEIGQIALNFSDNLTLDTLGHGNHERITGALTERYGSLEFISADPLITPALEKRPQITPSVDLDKETIERIILKREQTQRLMQDLGYDSWVIFVTDNDAEKAHLPLLGAPESNATRAYILTPNKAVALCPSEEAKAHQMRGFELTLIDEKKLTSENFPTILAEALEQHLDIDPDTKVGLNFSNIFGTVDTLGHKTYENLTATLEKKCEGLNLVSADQLIIAAASAKLPHEIELLTEAASLTDRVLRYTFSRIESGMTEKDVAKIAKDYIAGMMGMDPRIGYSWAKHLNPIVLTGKGIGRSPHAVPSDRHINRGDTVYIDLGISVNGYGGDLQHFGYVLEDGETEAPAEVQEKYDIIVKSIEAGMEAAVSGAKGYEVDKASRDVVLEAGYPSYEHSTGHQLGGGTCHAPGMLFERRFPNGEGTAEFPLSMLALQEGYTMTIEPRLQVANGASIEVDGIVTKDGFKPLVPMQDRIHLIR